MGSVLSLFRLIDNQKLAEAELVHSQPVLTYLLENDEVSIPVPNAFDHQIRINELDSRWTPELHGLTVKQTIIFKKFNAFFGEESITSIENKIGLAAKIYSRESNFQETVILDEFYTGDNESIFDLVKIFEENELRGSVSFEFFIFLRELNIKEKFQADMVGTILTEEPILEYTLLIDGDGSMFPIVEVYEVGKPLWSVNMSWEDALAEPFNTNYVSLVINRAHERYKDLVSVKSKQSMYLLDEIMITAMAMIMQKVLIEDLVSIEEIKDEALDGSIGKIIWYWYSSFDINVHSLASISESFHQYMENSN